MMKRLLVLGLTLGVFAVGSSAYTPKAELKKPALYHFVWTGSTWLQVNPDDFPTCPPTGDDCAAISDDITPTGQPAGEVDYFGQP